MHLPHPTHKSLHPKHPILRQTENRVIRPVDVGKEVDRAHGRRRLVSRVKRQVTLPRRPCHRHVDAPRLRRPRPPALPPHGPPAPPPPPPPPPSRCRPPPPPPPAPPNSPGS